MSTDEKPQFETFVDNLLSWYAHAARELPWRVGPVARARGCRPDPYRVWLAEIMLQQTTIAHATPYYQSFIRRWPAIVDLAAAQDADIMAAWAGLGYYARARNLHTCARLVAANAGVWPQDYKGLKALPGIGPYTAGAIAALAFDLPHAAVDANVERVFSRLLRLTGNWAGQKRTIHQAVQALVPHGRPAEFAEALMDLGAMICTPKSPQCSICPVAETCLARKVGDAQAYPAKPPKSKKPRRLGHVYVLVHTSQAVVTQLRPARGLLGGMLGLPTSDWQQDVRPPPIFPDEARWQDCGEIRHVFTHFELTLQVWGAHSDRQISDATPISSALDALPTVFRKALKKALKSVETK